MQAIATNDKQVVVGLGLTGLSCARYLSRTGQTFSIVDSRSQPPGLAEFNEEFPDVALSLGAISDADLAGASLLVVSPGVSLTEPAIAKAIDQGVAVCGDIDLFCAAATAPIIAITGSNGKSTVTTLLGLMVEACGKQVGVGGNIGIAALDLLTLDTPDYYVLELSSFQLERAGELRLSAATVLNISADHMDRYSSVATYSAAKHKIYQSANTRVFNRADPLTQPASIAADTSCYSFGLDAPGPLGFGLITQQGREYLAYQDQLLMPVDQLSMVGRHNIENALAALALGYAAGLEMKAMLAALTDFTGLAHRCQWVGQWQGVKYYNDSKATNVGATIAAVEGLQGQIIKSVLILGGESKGADFSPLIAVVAQHVRAVVLIGEASDELQKLLIEAIPALACKRADNIDAAVAAAAQLAQTGDAVLLSPACASFDMFANYQQRGEHFSSAVRLMAKGGQH